MMSYGNYRKMSTLTAAVLNISTGIEIGQYKPDILLSADSNVRIQLNRTDALIQPATNYITPC